MFILNNRDTKTTLNIFDIFDLTFGIVLVSSFLIFEHILHLVLVFLLLTLNMQLPAWVMFREYKSETVAWNVLRQNKKVCNVVTLRSGREKIGPCFVFFQQKYVLRTWELIFPSSFWQELEAVGELLRSKIKSEKEQISILQVYF